MRPLSQTVTIGLAILTPALMLITYKVLMKGKVQSSTDLALRNLRAFLLMIQYAEGTIGPNAYRTLFGGSLFIAIQVILTCMW